MFHYLFTNDLRIANLQEMLTEAGHCFTTDTVPSSAENKSKNNNYMTLGFYFNLTKESNCAKICANGDIRKVVLNFIKKFQFPNPRTSESMKDCMDDGIILAPMRLVIKLLYAMSITDNSAAFLTRTEIAKYIFFDADVAKKETPDILAIISKIKEYRKSEIDDSFPSEASLNAQNCYWLQCERQIREMIKILKWSGCVKETDEGRIYISHDDLTRDNEADIFEIVNYREYWKPDPTKKISENKDEYQKYMDIEISEVGKIDLNLESEFKAWLGTITKSNGEPYSENTLNQYMSAIKAVPTEFAEALSPYATIFNIADGNSFAIVKIAIESADNYADVNAARGNGALSACLDLYGRFLSECDTERLAPIRHVTD